MGVLIRGFCGIGVIVGEVIVGVLIRRLSSFALRIKGIVGVLIRRFHTATGQP